MHTGKLVVGIKWLIACSLGRAKHIKTSARVNCNEEVHNQKPRAPSPTSNASCQRILEKVAIIIRVTNILYHCCILVSELTSFVTQLWERLDFEDVKLLEELFIQEGIFFDPESVEELELAYEDVTLQTISSLQQAVEELSITSTEVRLIF